jgi:V/A-type H+/Na+-transporting ATPase subunit D
MNGTMSGPGQAPTRAALLELKNEQGVVNEAYAFLDEKRLLLAAELLRQVKTYQRLRDKIDALHVRAREKLQQAIKRHGLQGLEVYPAASLQGANFNTTKRNFMGVTLVETQLMIPTGSDTHPAAVNPSSEAEACHAVFQEIVQHSAILAGVSGNLYRLLAEYRITERRSRALENVILPEIEQSLKEMTTHLEELDLEDAIRVRLKSR